MNLQHHNCIIIGAGISGLMAAGRLKESGLDVLVLDKGRGVGGRMATRQIDGRRFDHGAQKITPATAEFASYVRSWLGSGKLSKYPGRSAGGKKNHPDRQAESYCSESGISTVPKHLAAGLNVITQCRVTRVTHDRKHWQLYTESNRAFSCDILILTPPVPQSLKLVEQSALETDTLEQLCNIRFDKCLAVMALYDSPGDLVHEGYIELSGSPISLISDNYHKRVSPEPGAITIHSSPAFAEEYWERAEGEVTSLLLAGTRIFTPREPVRTALHRWRYSQARASHPATFLLINGPCRLGFAGDSFAGDGIEGAALSGLRLAEAILAQTA